MRIHLQRLTALAIIIMVLVIGLPSCKKVVKTVTDSIDGSATKTVIKTTLPVKVIPKNASKNLISNTSSLVDFGYTVIKKGRRETIEKGGRTLGSVFGNVMTCTPQFPVLRNGIIIQKKNPLLDTDLLPDFTYKVGSIIYKTNSHGSVTYVKLDVLPKSVADLGRSKSKGVVSMMNNANRNQYEAGHIIAKADGGCFSLINTFPQLIHVNQKSWKNLDFFIRENKSYIKNIEITLHRNPSTNFVESLEKSFYLKGVKKTNVFSNLPHIEQQSKVVDGIVIYGSKE